MINNNGQNIQSPMQGQQARPNFNQFNNNNPSMQNPQEIPGSANQQQPTAEKRSGSNSNPQSPFLNGQQATTPQPGSNSPKIQDQQPVIKTEQIGPDDNGQAHATIAGMRVTVLSLTQAEKELVVARVIIFNFSLNKSSPPIYGSTR